MTRTQKAILATVLNCEGCITLVKGAPQQSRRTPIYTVKVNLSMTVPFYVKQFIKHFGGVGRWRKARRAIWKPQFSWEVSSELAANVLIQLAPFLKIKQEQARVGLTLHKIRQQMRKTTPRVWGPGKSLPTAILQKYEELYQEMRRLNARGI